MPIAKIQSMVFHVSQGYKPYCRVKIFLDPLVIITTTPALVIRITDTKTIGSIISGLTFGVRFLVKSYPLEHPATRKAGITITEIHTNKIIIKIGLGVTAGSQDTKLGFLQYVQGGPTHKNFGCLNTTVFILALADDKSSNIPVSYSPAKFRPRIDVHRGSGCTQAYAS